MKTRWLTLALLGLSLAAGEGPAGLKVYSLVPQHFQISLPATWVKLENKNVDVVLLVRPDINRGEGKTPDVFDIVVKQMAAADKRKTLDQMVTNAIDASRKTKKDLADVTIKGTTVDGEEGRFYSFTHEFKGRKTAYLHVIARHGENFYMMLYMCDAEDLAAAQGLFDDAMGTFKWLP